MSERTNFIPENPIELAKRCAAALLAGSLALGLAGCKNANPENPSSSSNGIHTSTPPPSARQLLADPDLLRTAYPELPAKVQKAAEAVVYVNEDATEQIDKIYPDGRVVAGRSVPAYRKDYPGVLDGANGTGSVVHVAKNDGSIAEVILTAAHVAIGDSDHCAETTISQLRAGGHDTIVSRAQKQALIYKGTPATTSVSTPDKAVILAGDKDRPFIRLRSKPHTLQPGEVAFSVNYMPLKDGTLRDPTNADSTEHPAEYSMMALGTDPRTGMEVFLERGRSYGAQEDTVSRPGASGGPVILADGTQYGLTTGFYEDVASPQTEAFDLGQIAANTKDPEIGDMLRNIVPEKGDGLVLVQPVAQAEVNTLYMSAASSPDCTARPHVRVHVK